MQVRMILRWLLVVLGLLVMAAGLREKIVSRQGQNELAGNWGQSNGEQSSRKTEKFPEPHGPGASIARLSIPRLHTDLLVVSGAGKAELRKGPGHLKGTALPGAVGNSVIAGHRDTHFRVLKHIRIGDRIVIQTAQGRFAYDVERTMVVPPTARDVLAPTDDSRLTLVTCFPFYYAGPAPERFIVQAKLAAVNHTGAD